MIYSSFINYYIIILGDEILSVNNAPTRGLSHAGAISLFKQVKEGKIELTLSRRRYFPIHHCNRFFRGYNSITNINIIVCSRAPRSRSVEPLGNFRGENKRD